MNLEFKKLLNQDLSPASRVWIYQCHRLFTLSEALGVEERLHEFTAQWKSHGAPVKGEAYLFFGQFIVLLADESATGVSGCSTDSSVRLLKNIEQQYDVNVFDRTTLAFVVKHKIELLPLSQLQYAFENNFINADTLYFNNLVQTKKELEGSWIVSVKDSWLWKKLREPHQS